MQLSRTETLRASLTSGLSDQSFHFTKEIRYANAEAYHRSAYCRGHPGLTAFSILSRWLAARERRYEVHGAYREHFQQRRASRVGRIPLAIRPVARPVGGARQGSDTLQ